PGSRSSSQPPAASSTRRRCSRPTTRPSPPNGWAAISRPTTRPVSGRRPDWRLTMFRTIAAVAALLAINGATASAGEVAEFYRGKTVRLIIGYGTGGGYDIYGKFFARYLGEHIPGKPTVIAQNMPGAGSRSAANWLYKVAPKDGTVLAVLGQATPADQALG